VLADTQAQVAHAHLKAGSIKGLSIGFDVPDGKASYDSNGVRTLSEIRLWEVSVVTFPMNQSAIVTSVKSLQDAVRVVREAAAHPQDAEAATILRSLLKDITALLPLDTDEEEDEDDQDDSELIELIEDEKAAARILQDLLLELKGQSRRAFHGLVF
jgi:hypothetical protein